MTPINAVPGTAIAFFLLLGAVGAFSLASVVCLVVETVFTKQRNQPSRVMGLSLVMLVLAFLALSAVNIMILRGDVR